MAHDVFISHSKVDKEVAEAVCDGLEKRGIRCWIAPRDIVPGADWGAAIIDAISDSRVMVLIFSSNANASRQIKREIERADSKGVRVIPFRIENVAPTKTLEYFISTPHWFDAYEPPLAPHVERLGGIIQAHLARTSRTSDTGVPVQRPATPLRSASARTAAASAPLAAIPPPEPSPRPAPAPAQPNRRRLVAVLALAALAAIGYLLVSRRSPPPQILSVQFPAAIYAGQQGNGAIYFRDKKGDLTNARFEVVQSTTFQGFSFPTTNYAGKTAGEIRFWLTCPVPQHIVLQAVLTDSSGKRSNPVPFAFDVQPVPAPVYQPPRPKSRTGRDFTIEAPNGMRFKIPR